MAIYEAGVPVLGICYGEQAMAHQLGGKVEGGHHREFGRAEVLVTLDSPLLAGTWRKGERYPVWMSHGDRVTQLPEGFRVIATSPNAPIAMIADEQRRFYATQFHLEVVHPATARHRAWRLRNGKHRPVHHSLWRAGTGAGVRILATGVLHFCHRLGALGLVQWMHPSSLSPRLLAENIAELAEQPRAEITARIRTIERDGVQNAARHLAALLPAPVRADVTRRRRLSERESITWVANGLG